MLGESCENTGKVVTAFREVTDSAVAGGLADPPGPVVAAAGEALGRGMTPDDVRGLVAAARTPEDAAAGLAVAASLCVQGLERRAAERAVQGAYGQGSGPEHLFEPPSAVADMTGRATPMSDVARRIMQGGGLPLPPTAGPGQGQGRPGTIPPTPGGKKCQGMYLSLGMIISAGEFDFETPDDFTPPIVPNTEDSSSAAGTGISFRFGFRPAPSFAFEILMDFISYDLTEDPDGFTFDGTVSTSSHCTSDSKNRTPASHPAIVAADRGVFG